MAMSNIFNEPRREITESLAGYVAIALYLTGMYFISTLVYAHSDKSIPVFGVLLMSSVAVPLFCLIMYGVIVLFPHFVGEIVCDALDNRGLELRPKERYRRDNYDRY